MSEQRLSEQRSSEQRSSEQRPSSSPQGAASPLLALVGKPNCGKTTLFNQLSGLQLKTGNYAGVTVTEGWGTLELSGRRCALVDLPGARQLSARSPDEAVTARRLLGLSGAVPDLLLLVADATQLGESLSLTLQAIELGRPALLIVNQIDLARERGLELDPEALSSALGLPVCLVSARSGEGLDRLWETLHELIETLGERAGGPQARAPWLPGGALIDLEARLSSTATGAQEKDAEAYRAPHGARERWLAGAALCDEPLLSGAERLAILQQMRGEEALLEEVAIARFRWIDEGLPRWQQRRGPDRGAARDARLDRVLLHPLWGTLIALFAALCFFQALFSFADPFVGLIEEGLAHVGAGLRRALPDGLLEEAIVDGALAGVGNVLVFIPQLAILFTLLGLLEGCGYLTRAAAIVDRLMRKVGLDGRAFIPLLSGYACAVPAILAARALPRRRDRQLVLLALPLTTCSARLPVYTLLIAALIPAGEGLGPFDQRGLLLAALYLLGGVAVLLLLTLLHRIRPPDPPAPMLLELPPYRVPELRALGAQLHRQLGLFIREAGRVILVGTMILWVLLSFPRLEERSMGAGEEARVGQRLESTQDLASKQSAAAIQSTASMSAPTGASLEARQKAQSYAGQLGRAMGPLLHPIGWNWEVGVGLIGAFAAREVFVSTMGLVYGIPDADEESASLRRRLAEARGHDGARLFTPLSTLALLIFFTIAFQCLSTLAVLRRAFGGWRWPIGAVLLLNGVAWLMALLVYQGGRLLGFT